jgi:hypothetical protein
MVHSQFTYDGDSTMGFGCKERNVIRNRAIDLACLAFFDNTDSVHSSKGAPLFPPLT